MIKTFSGVLLSHPIPLELSLGRCSHKCAYCFVDSNHGGKLPKSLDPAVELPKIMRFLGNYRTRHTLAAKLLAEGYPVCLSNRVDPFATSTYRTFLPLIETMAALDIPLFFQTKGGRGIDRVLSFLKPSLWYVTIETINDAVGKRISNAPSPSERLALLDKLQSHGHKVMVGLNPFVREWVGDVEEYGRVLLAHGVRDIVLQPLHFSYKRVKLMSFREREAIGESVIKRASSKRSKIAKAAYQDAIEARNTLVAMGFNVDLPGYWGKVNHRAIFQSVYGKKIFPTLHDFTDVLLDLGVTPESGVITVEDYFEFFLGGEKHDKFPKDRPLFPDVSGWGLSPNAMREYVLSGARRFENKVKITGSMRTYRDALFVPWMYEEHPKALRKSFALAAACKRYNKKPDGYVLLTDENGVPYHVFIPGGLDVWYYDIIEGR